METAISSATIQLAGFLRSTPHPLKDGASVRVLPPRPQSRNAPAVQIMRTPMMAKTPRQSVNMRPACASRAHLDLPGRKDRRRADRRVLQHHRGRPIQLATYAATLANNGTRYRTHFVKAILDSNTGEVISETQPEVMDIIEGTGNTFELVRQGMRQVPSTITNSKISSYPIAIACKTGTPQRSETYAQPRIQLFPVLTRL